jgi:predicted ArsR family transcriptional regulator
MVTDTTRERVLGLIVSAGPIAAANIAEQFELTPAAVRRHLSALTDDGLIADHEVAGPIDRGRGRPAKAFVATPEGQRALKSAYSDVAQEAMRFLKAKGELASFVADHGSRFESKLAGSIDTTAPVATRVGALSDALATMGYATSVRPGPGGHTLQLCQGHCPVQEIAQATPEWCEEETKAFSRVLGVHVQRLSTLAQGAHVCTTTIPLTPALKEG